MRYATAQRTSIGYSPWLNQYPSRVALQQSSFLFLDKHNENKFDFVYLQPVLIMGGLRPLLDTLVPRNSCLESIEGRSDLLKNELYKEVHYLSYLKHQQNHQKTNCYKI